MNDILWISVDYAANVLGIQHTVLGGGGNCNSDSTIDKDALEEFNTDVLVKRSEIGQVYVLPKFHIVSFNQLISTFHFSRHSYENNILI